MNSNDLSRSVIFPIGEKLASPHFNGTVWLNMLTPSGSACAIAKVSPEKGPATWLEPVSDETYNGLP